MKGVRFNQAKQIISGALAALIIKVLSLSLRWEKQSIATAKERLAPDTQCIFAFWHDCLLGLPTLYRKTLGESKRKLYVLISKHGDGRLIARAAAWFGVDSIAGSSSRGALGAFLGMVKVAEEEGAYLGITPDGPRGPRHECKRGIVALAQHTKIAIVPATYAVQRCWRLPSWDGMKVPKPFSRAALLFGESIVVSPDEDLEDARARVERSMRELTETAERYWSDV
jgi:lysophospholipid acyltransferase (LPLAT)-like uncharacterized protein